MTTGRATNLSSPCWRAPCQRRSPILGICRGAQMINVGFGGALYQDMKEDAAPQLEHRQTELGKSRQEPTHAVLVTDPNRAWAPSCRAPAA